MTFINSFHEGIELPPFKIKVEAQKYRKYNRLIKEINPIHFNKKYAQNLGFDSIVVAGNFLFTYIPKWLIDWIGDARIIKRITINFQHPIYADDVIIHKGKIVKIIEKNNRKVAECEYIVQKENGQKTANGTITFQI